MTVCHNNVNGLEKARDGFAARRSVGGFRGVGRERRRGLGPACKRPSAYRGAVRRSARRVWARRSAMATGTA